MRLTLFTVIHRGIARKRFEDFDKIVIIVYANHRGDFGQRQIGTDNQIPRLFYPFFRDIVFRRRFHVGVEDGIELFLS